MNASYYSGQNSNEYQADSSIRRVPFAVLTTMIGELFESYSQKDVDVQPSIQWCSESQRTRVIRDGNDVAFKPIVEQKPDDSIFKYRLEFDTHRVYQWVEYRWPYLQTQKVNTRAISVISLPEACFQELLYFHSMRQTPWLQRFHLWQSSEFTL